MLSSSMRRAGVVRAILRAAASGTLLHVFAFSTAACRLPEPEAKPPLTLVEKGATQSVFDAGGALGRTGRLMHSIEELDTDGDGRGDRRLVRDADGILTAILIDSERNGTWARRVEVERPRHP